MTSNGMVPGVVYGILPGFLEWRAAHPRASLLERNAWVMAMAQKSRRQAVLRRSTASPSSEAQPVPGARRPASPPLDQRRQQVHDDTRQSYQHLVSTAVGQAVVAYHETGHALVVERVWPGALDELTMLAADSVGACYFTPPAGARPRDSMLVYAAGTAAAGVHDVQLIGRLGLSQYGLANDQEKFGQQLGRPVDSEDPDWTDCVLECIDYLHDHKPALRAVADALVVAGQLPGRRVRELVAEYT
jgi:hypothetical protein